MPSWLHKALTAVATVGAFAAEKFIPASAAVVIFGTSLPVSSIVAAALVAGAAVGIQPSAVSTAISNLFHGAPVTKATAVAMQAAITKGKPANQ